MAVQNTDLVLVQRGNLPYRATTETLATYINSEITSGGAGADVPTASASVQGVVRVGNNLTIEASTGILSATIPAGLEFQGLWSNASASPATGSLTAGNFYIWNGTSPATLSGTSWGSLDGTEVTTSDRLMWTASDDWVDIGPLGGGGITSVSGTAPIVVDTTTDPDVPDVSISAASGSAAGSMSSADFSKLSGIEAGAQVNVNPTVSYNVVGGTDGTITMQPGGSTAIIDNVTTSRAGLMSAADKVTLDGLSSNPSGVSSVTAGDGITVTGTAAVPTINANFGSVGSGTPTTIMPYDISMLTELP